LAPKNAHWPIKGQPKEKISWMSKSKRGIDWLGDLINGHNQVKFMFFQCASLNSSSKKQSSTTSIFVKVGMLACGQKWQIFFWEKLRYIGP